MSCTVNEPKVLIVNTVPDDVDGVVAAVATYVKTGVVPPNAHIENLTTFMQRGRVADCDCRMIECVCAMARQHKSKCAFRKALTCAVGIACDDHDREVCPICDPCTCK